MKKFFISSVIMLSGAAAAQAQVKFGDNPGTINGGSLVELESTNKGLLLTRVNLTKTTVWGLAGTPVNGMTVYNLSAAMTGTAKYPALKGVKGVYYWDGTAWIGVGEIKIPDQTVEVSGMACGLTSPNPFAGGTFDPATPASEDPVYINTCDGTTWIYDAGTGQYQSVDNTGTPFYISGTTTDALGNKTRQIRRNGSVAIGKGSWAGGATSLAVGNNDTASGTGSIAFGSGTRAAANWNMVGGTNSLNAGPNSIVVGIADSSTGTGNAVFGWQNKSDANYGFVAGRGNTLASASLYSSAIGYQNYSNQTYNHILGFQDSVTGGSYNFATGQNNKINGTSAHANVIGGRNNTMTGAISSVVFGEQNTASAFGSSTLGQQNNNAAPNSLTVGNNNILQPAATNSTVSGAQNLAGAPNAAISGFQNHIQSAANGHIIAGVSDTIVTTTGAGVAVFGTQNKYFENTGTIGRTIIAGHRNNAVNASYSAVFGQNNSDSASHTLVAGQDNTVGTSGTGSTVLGRANRSNGTNSVALGTNMNVDANSAVGINLNATAQTLSQANTMSVMGGNVGIGTTTPITELHIKSPGAVGNHIIQENAAAPADQHLWQMGTGGDSTYIFQALNDAIVGGGHIFQFVRNGNQINQLQGLNNSLPWFTIHNLTRRVGIGVVSPGAKLHVIKAAADLTPAIIEGCQDYADNAAAIAAGLPVGAIYRTGDVMKVVH